MQSNLALGNMNLGDISILYVLIALLILLALIAAIGAWVRGGGIKKEDAQSFFSEASERHREEIARLEALLHEARTANEQAHASARQAYDRSSESLTSRLQEVDQQVQRSRSLVEAAVSQASSEYTEALSDELEMVVRKLGETDRRVTTGMADLQDSLGRIQVQVSQAGDQIRHALMEISKQQQDQKAQSTIQMCEALISSLSTLKSSIANQLDHQHDARTVDAESSSVDAEPAASVGETSALDSEPATLAFSSASEEPVEQTAVGDLRFASDEETEAETGPEESPAENHFDAADADRDKLNDTRNDDI